MFSASVCFAQEEFPLSGSMGGAAPGPGQGAGTGYGINTASLDLQLEVYINGHAIGFIAAFVNDPERGLLIEQNQMRNIGIWPDDAAIGIDGMVNLAMMDSLSYRINTEEQTIYFNIFDASRIPRQFDVLSAGASRHYSGIRTDPLYGGLINYLIRAEALRDDSDMGVGNDLGLSGAFDTHAFTQVGRFDTDFVIDTLDDVDLAAVRRLNSSWNLSDPDNMLGYHAGDLVTGGLIWSRPVRIAGFQVERNFRLRPDLVTNPLPAIRGSASVPSTVDVYVDNARRYSTNVPAGPFEISNIPVVSGYGTTRIVVRDVLGREQVTELPFFTSPRLLSKGLLDFSFEAGIARRNFGIESNDYSGGPVSTGTVRYGLYDDLALTGHSELTPDVAVVGVGIIANAMDQGVVSFSGAGSGGTLGSGIQLATSAEFNWDNLYLYFRSQRTFGDYSDAATVTAENITDGSGNISYSLPPKALDQVSLSIPLGFDPSVLNLGFTNLERQEDEPSRILSFSVSRRMENDWNLFANAYRNMVGENEYGAFVGLSFPLGGHNVTTGVSKRRDGLGANVDIVKPARRAVGSYGWRASLGEGTVKRRKVAGIYRAQPALLSGDLEQTDDEYRMTMQAEGSTVLAASELYFANRIDSAFAVVDAGAPNVDVRSENRSIGQTGENGKILVPNLRAWEPNRLAIDPLDLPLNADVEHVRQVIVPSDNGAANVKFNVRGEIAAAIVILRDENGDYIPPGSRGRLVDDNMLFTVGYDGQAYIRDLRDRNHILVNRPGQSRCEAFFNYERKSTEQVMIDNVVCRRIRSSVPSP